MVDHERRGGVPLLPCGVPSWGSIRCVENVIDDTQPRLYILVAQHAFELQGRYAHAAAGRVAWTVTFTSECVLLPLEVEGDCVSPPVDVRVNTSEP